MVDFLGIVSGRISTSNFSFTAQSKVKKFDYIKIYHEEAGFVLCQVTDLMNENNVITCNCEVIGYKDAEGLLKVPKTTISSQTEIYRADNEFIKKILDLDKEKGLYLGVLENYPLIKVMIDFKKLVTKHLAVLAKTGAGKSYTLGVIVEELLQQGMAIIIIDPHGEYSSLKYPNSDEADIEKMKNYDIKPRGFESQVIEYSPDILINPEAKPLSISINSLTAHEVSVLTPIKIGGTQLGMLYNAISEAKKDSPEYDLDDIRVKIDEINSNNKYSLYSCLDFIENLGVFSKNPVKVEDLAIPGKASLINLKGTEPEIQKIIAAKICNDLFEKRKKGLIPPIFLIIEEAHNFCPERSFGESPSSHILRNIASEGRKFGLGMGVVTQRPARIDKNILSQCNTQIIHKVTNPNDIKAIGSSAENLNATVINDIPSIAIGTALIIGANPKPLIASIRPKMSLHGGRSVSFKESFSQAEKPMIAKEQKPIKKESPPKETLPAKEKIQKTPSKPIESETINISIANINDSKKLAPAYLATIINEGKEICVLVGKDADAILNPKNDDSNESGLLEGLSPKAKSVMELLLKNGQANMSLIFNTFDYSFQDINYIINDLASKNKVSIINGKIFPKKGNESFEFKKSLESAQIKRDLLKNDIDNSKKAKEFLEKKGIKCLEIKKIYIR